MSPRRIRPGITLMLLLAVAAGVVGIQATDNDESRTVSLLVDRVVTLHTLWAGKQYGEVYELLSSRYRLGAEDKKQYIRDAKKGSRRIRISHWELISIFISGSQAKVTLVLTGRIKEGLVGWEDAHERVDEYWVLEDDNWYKSVSKPHAWNDTEAHEAPLPASRRQLGYIGIKPKN